MVKKQINKKAWHGNNPPYLINNKEIVKELESLSNEEIIERLKYHISEYEKYTNEFKRRVQSNKDLKQK